MLSVFVQPSNSTPERIIHTSRLSLYFYTLTLSLEGTGPIESPLPSTRTRHRCTSFYTWWTIKRMKGFRTRLSGPVQFSLSSIQNSTNMVSCVYSQISRISLSIELKVYGYVRLVCIPVENVHVCMCYVKYRCGVRFKMCSTFESTRISVVWDLRNYNLSLQPVPTQLCAMYTLCMCMQCWWQYFNILWVTFVLEGLHLNSVFHWVSVSLTLQCTWQNTVSIRT